MRIRTFVLFLFFVLISIIGYLLFKQEVLQKFNSNNEVDNTSSVFISSPVDGAVVSGFVSVSVEVKNIQNAKALVIFIDGSKKATCLIENCVYKLKTQELVNGKHSISAKAEDSNGKIFKSQSVAIVVKNEVDKNQNITNVSSNTKPTSNTVIKNSTTSTTSVSLKISSISAKNLASSVETVTWKTNIPSQGKIVYGLVSSSNGIYDLSTKMETSLSLDHSLDLVDLVPGKKYFYKVISTDAKGEEASSAELSFTSSSLKISSLKVENISSIGATVSWTTNLKTQGQIIYGAISSNSGVYDFSTNVSDNIGTLHSIDLTRLLYNTKYYYRIVSIDSLGHKDISPEYNFTTSLIYNVSSQKNFSNTQISILWNTSLPTKSEIKYGTQSSSSGTYSFSASDFIYVSSHNFTLANLLANTKYYYRIISTDENGKKTTSSEYSFSTE
ncbi:fibronectin type III domain-containing protein [Candidatus Nomurabacteria bacterium]|nr:fibronectin type III domain-containing protein [Candidatus Nomurabacteria bacterium]